MRELAKTRRLFVPVMPGFDGTPVHEKVRSMKGLGSLAAEFIEKAVGPRSDVAGCSFGGCVALWLAVQHPERVDHLVLECPAGLSARDPALRANPELFRKALFAHPEKMPPDSKPPEMEGANRKMLPHYGAESGVDQELISRLGKIHNVSLILHGVLDRIIPKEDMQRLKQQLKNSYLIYFWDAAHGIEVDQPERALEAVRGFLERSGAFVVPAIPA